ncbi:interleukin-1 receptor type 2 [Mugil cephalus]|uniref:interleukin-1 receptor type 2 n=1 Tax=Mugil cephalus TaxID=48193 RepID=UPI001FB6251C|nr:interleukin-1 receptor type 2 [Mugil cephalus]XP_047456157.1 interleukin-1 receptor type 2 [Mugil cephalus]XP_047456158.1 interleukin-1 receptor type 2 [Mugil cephalus]
MVTLTLMFALVIINCVYGRPPLPRLPMKDGCYVATEEVALIRGEGDAIILYFPMFMRALELRKITPETTQYLIGKENGDEDFTYEGEGRVQQHNGQLWFLPAQASDSGNYTCTYRNETYCMRGRITLHVYELTPGNVDKLSYPVSAMVGEELRFSCPSLDNFNVSERLIKWYKEPSPSALQKGEAGSLFQDGGKLTIPSVRLSHAGTYTCQLRALINNQRYNVSRVIVLSVQGTDPEITTTIKPNFPMSSEPGPRIIYSTIPAPVFQPPKIVLPINGTVLESSHGSGVELFCHVLTECPAADSTTVAWLVNGQTVESSYLDPRALQGGRRVNRVSTGCQIELRLVIAGITEEDVNTEMKCVAQNNGGRQEVVALLQLEDSTFTWLVVAAVALTCFLTVVSIFMYVLFKPKRKKKMDYFLARQSSTF